MLQLIKWKFRYRFGGWFRYRIDTYGLIIEKRGLFRPVELHFKRGFTICGTRVDGPVKTICEGQNYVKNCDFTDTLGIHC